MAVVSSEGGDENKTSAITDSVPGVFTNNYSSTIFSVVRDSSTFIPKDMSCDDCSDDEVKKLTPSFWQVLSAWCFPFLLLWLRRSLLGTATVHLLRSLLMGEGINFVASQYGDVPKWVYSLTDPHAWPPPAFTILALITLIALIAHPDGLTWFMLGKLRDVLFTILHTVASCWTLFIQDYGIVTTTVALMTLTGIACLLGILLRNALPKAMCKRRTQDAQDRRNKKKRKGLKGLGRLKSPRKSDAHETSSQDNETSIFTHPCSLSVDSLVAEEIVDKHSSTVTPQLEVIAPYSPTRSTFRQRTPSSSTIDTTLDDTSCDSLSVRSFSSTPTAVTVGSTGNSESGKSMKRHGKKSLKNTRLHHGSNDIQEAQPVPDDSTKLHKRQNISISIMEDQTPQSKPSRENANQPSPSQVAVDNLKQSHSDASSIGSGDNKQSQTGPSELTGYPGNHHTGYKVTSGLSRYTSEIPPKSPDRKQPLPTPPGRFSNLKERDTRFSNSRKNHGRLVQGKGKSRMKTGQSTSSTSSPRHAKSSENANRCKNSIKDFEQPSASEPVSKKCDKDKLKTTGTPSLKENRTQKFASSVQYGSPCNAEESITPKKLELGSFLASVGIVGRSDSKQTLDTKFSDSDDLERLSFQLQTSYPQMQNNLGRVWEQHQPTRWNHDYGRTPPPPPGLSSIHDEPPTLFGTPTHRNEATPNILTTSERFSPTAWYPLANPFVAFEDPKPDRVLDDEESRIEAELQELGGQMIGSILDF